MKLQFDGDDLFKLLFSPLMIELRSPVIRYRGEKKAIVDPFDQSPVIYVKFNLVTFNGFDEYNAFIQSLESKLSKIMFNLEKFIYDNPEIDTVPFWDLIEEKLNILKQDYYATKDGDGNLINFYLSNAKFENIGEMQIYNDIDDYYMDTTLTPLQLKTKMQNELEKFSEPVIHLLDELISHIKLVLNSKNKIKEELNHEKIEGVDKMELKILVSENKVIEAMDKILSVLKKMPLHQNDVILLRRRLIEKSA